MKKLDMLGEFQKCQTPDEKFSYLCQLNFPILLREKNNLFHAFIPSLSLSCTHSSVEECYKKIKSLKEEHFKRLILNDCAEDVLFSNSHFFFWGELNRLKVLGLKYLMTFTFICILVLFLGWQASAFVSRTLNKVGGEAQKISVLLQSDIKTMREVTPEKRKEHLQKFRKNLEEIKPYSDLIREVIFDSKVLYKNE